MRKHEYVKAFGVPYTLMIKLFWKYHAVRKWVQAPGDNRRNPIYHKVKKMMGPVIEEYRGQDNLPIADAYFEKRRPLWFFWWQGKDEMPEPVRLCYHRMLQCVPENVAEVCLITKDNHKDYYDLPGYIFDKLGKGLAPVDVSDISRHILLSEYGGVWLDANYYAGGRLPEEWFSAKGVFTRRKNYACWPPHFGNWSSSFIAAPPGTVTTRFVRDALLHYWKNHDIRIDYTLQAQLLSIAYEIFPATKHEIDALPVHSRPLFLDEILNEPYEERRFLEVLTSQEAHKIPYKYGSEMMTPDGKPTVYAHLIEMDKETCKETDKMQSSL